MPPLWKQRCVLGIDESVEIGCIKEESSQIDLEIFNQAAGEFLFDLGDSILIELTHVIPETLA